MAMKEVSSLSLDTVQGEAIQWKSTLASKDPFHMSRLKGVFRLATKSFPLYFSNILKFGVANQNKHTFLDTVTRRKDPASAEAFV